MVFYPDPCTMGFFYSSTLCFVHVSRTKFKFLSEERRRKVTKNSEKTSKWKLKIGSEMKLNLLLKVDGQLDDAKKTGKKN